MLVLCPTPIGNLDDISISMEQAMKKADIIYAEDTRRTLKLLNHLKISCPIKSYHEHNKEKIGEEILTKLEQGNTIVLTTDAGMPGISDPGSDLVRLCIKKGLPYNVLAGPTAFSVAAVASGFDITSFCFEGFLPKKKSNKEERLQAIKNDERTHIFYESPHALPSTLETMHRILGNRNIFLGRELTKMHQEYRHGTFEKLIDYYTKNQPRGEFVLVVEGATILPPIYDEAYVIQALLELYKDGISRKEAIALVATETKLKKSYVYKIAQSLK